MRDLEIKNFLLAGATGMVLGGLTTKLQFDAIQILFPLMYFGLKRPEELFLFSVFFYLEKFGGIYDTTTSVLAIKLSLPFLLKTKKNTAINFILVSLVSLAIAGEKHPALTALFSIPVYASVSLALSFLICLLRPDSVYRTQGVTFLLTLFLLTITVTERFIPKVLDSTYQVEVQSQVEAEIYRQLGNTR